MVDGQETVQIAWGELRWQGTRQHSNRGNSLGRAPRGRSDTEAMKGWTDGKPWEIIWGGKGHCGK